MKGFLHSKIFFRNVYRALSFCLVLILLLSGCNGKPKADPQKAEKPNTSSAADGDGTADDTDSETTSRAEEETDVDPLAGEISFIERL